jgi:hypothetical protein
MKQNLQNKLYKFFPKIFIQKNMPKEQTCMCWGIECPDEWYQSIYNLCEFIQNFVDTHKVTQIEAVQVKEKFGKLCFYTNYQHPYVQGAIGMTQYFLQPFNQLLDEPKNYKLKPKEIQSLRKGKKKLGKFAQKRLKEMMEALRKL